MVHFGDLPTGDILKPDPTMGKQYIERRQNGYFVKGTRVSLDSVVCAFLRGESPEGIASSFPVLNLEQVFGALAFYMANREKVDRYLSEGRQEFEAPTGRAGAAVGATFPRGCGGTSR